jgi:hypothetical protein
MYRGDRDPLIVENRKTNEVYVQFHHQNAGHIYNIGRANKFFEIVKRFTNTGSPLLNQFYFNVEINNRLHIVLFNFGACIFSCPLETCKD